MDAITYLRQEHSKFRRLLADISKTSSDKVRKRKFKAFCRDLVKHETMEQKIWYPKLRQYTQLKDTIKHLISEEKSAAKAIKAFNKVRFELMWDLRFYKFKHDVDHHAKEEEQELFPKVRKILNKQELNVLGTKMRQFKNRLK